MTQLLENPTLKWDNKAAERISDSDVERPIAWAYVRDPQRPAAFSYHRDNGFHIGGGWRALKAGYQQRVKLVDGQRYVLKARFEPEVHDSVGTKYSDGSVNVYWFVSGKQGGLSKLSPANKHVPTTHMTVIEATASGAFDVAFWLESKYAYEAVKMTVFSLECEEVGKDYGGSDVLKVTPTVPDSTPPPAPEPPKPDPVAIEAIALVSTPPPVNVRSNAGLEYPVIGELRNGERIRKLGVKLDTTGAEWLHFKRYGYDGTPTLTGYTSLKNGVVRVQELNVTAPPTTPPPTPPGDGPTVNMPKEAYDKLIAEKAALTERVENQVVVITTQGDELRRLRQLIKDYQAKIQTIKNEVKELFELEELKAS